MRQLTRPAWKSCWCLETPAGDGVVLRSETCVRFLVGRGVRLLANLLNGQRTVEDLIAELASEVPEEQVRTELARLDEAGYLRDGVPESPASDAWWELAGLDPAASRQARAEAAIDVVALGQSTAQTARQTLSGLNVRVDATARFRLVIASDYLSPALSAINWEALRQGSPWLLARPFGGRHWIGPLFVPGRTPCWDCLAHWLRVNGWSANAVVANLPEATASTEILASVEAARYLQTGRDSGLEGQIRELDTTTLTIETHRVLPSPGCRQCQAAAPHPGELRQFVSPITGIAKKPFLAFAHPALSVVAAEGNQVLRPDPQGDHYYVRPGLSVGRGQTPAEAEIRCLGEAIERYSAQFHGDEARIQSSIRELDGLAIEPGELLLDQSPPLDRDVRIDWTAARSIINGRQRFVPSSYCYFGYGDQRCGASSNGCAAGPTREDALLGGLLELVERDAIAVWWYNRIRRPALDLDHGCSDRLAALFATVGRRDRVLHVLDLTTDLRIPACVAISARADGTEAVLGTGCGPSAEAAAWSALTEMAVHLFEVEAGQEVKSVALEPWMLPEGLSSLPVTRAPAGDPITCLQTYARHAAEAGLDVLAIDLTRPEIGVPAMRVISPGLRHWKPRFAPGRLYDVPVMLGWRAHRLSVAELNPIPFPL